MSMFDKLKQSLGTVNIDGQTYFVAEGDTLLSEEQLQKYAGQREAIEQARIAMEEADAAGMGTTGLAEPAPRSLVVMTQSGKIVRWKPGTLLKYRIVKESFTDDEYDIVRASMNEATDAWENTCGVKFNHQKDLDAVAGTGHEGTLFTVRKVDTGGELIAAAFFPNDPVERRHVIIDPSFFSPDLGFDAIGVIRHELGHVLGFRHEHIRSNAPADCPDESLFDADNLTKYDPKSVMHYFCGDVGSQELAITDLDREGAQKVYGPPLSRVMEFTP